MAGYLHDRDWFTWVTYNASNTILMTPETGVVELPVTQICINNMYK
jgi:hypothetical protein